MLEATKVPKMGIAFVHVRNVFIPAAVVSGGYIWTVGQGGFEATNNNLCVLWAHLPLPTYRACEFQYVLVIVWTAVILTAAAWGAVNSVRLVARVRNRRNRLVAHWLLFAIFLVGAVVSLVGLVDQYRTVASGGAGDIAKIDPPTAPPNLPKAADPPAAPPAAPIPDPESIYQGGIVVGHVFGARRHPNDATRFTFVEITKSSQFNQGEPFEFQGLSMRMESAQSRIGMSSARPQDGTIYSGLVARILTPQTPSQVPCRGLNLSNIKATGTKGVVLYMPGNIDCLNIDGFETKGTEGVDLYLGSPEAKPK